MNDLYTQKFGSKRVVAVCGWTSEDAIVYDFKDELTYALSWDIFFIHHEKIDPFDCDVSKYVGPDLTIK